MDPLTKEWRNSDRIVEKQKFWDSNDEEWYVRGAMNWYIRKVRACPF